MFALLCNVRQARKRTQFRQNPLHEVKSSEDLGDTCSIYVRAQLTPLVLCQASMLWIGWCVLLLSMSMLFFYISLFRARQAFCFNKCVEGCLLLKSAYNLTLCATRIRSLTIYLWLCVCAILTRHKPRIKIDNVRFIRKDEANNKKVNAFICVVIAHWQHGIETGAQRRWRTLTLRIILDWHKQMDYCNWSRENSLEHSYILIIDIRLSNASFS